MTDIKAASDATCDLWRNAIRQTPLVAILRGIKPEEAIPVGNTLIEEGFSIIEVPLNSPEPYDTLKIMAQNFADKAILGAGTVLTAQQVKAVIDTGCKLIIAPNFDPDVARACQTHRAIYCPGVATPSEAFAALKAGAHGLKLFPAESIAPAAVKAMRAVLPQDTILLPVGGITPQNMADYKNAGADGFGIGSALYKAGKTNDAIRASAREFLDSIQ